MDIGRYLGFSYEILAQRLSAITRKSIEPSQLEVVANASEGTKHEISIAEGIISGFVMLKGDSYQAELVLRLPREKLRVLMDEPAYDKPLLHHFRVALAILAYLAENPSEGISFEGGREFVSFD